MSRVLTALFALALLFAPQTALATCGGGGGGGMGGVAPGAAAPQVYRVSWKVMGPGAAAPTAPEAALVIYWFPTSPAKAQSSSLQTSRTLSLAGARCVAAALVTPDHKALHDQFSVPADQEVAVLAQLDGTEIGRIGGAGSTFEPVAVDKLLNRHLEAQEKSLEALLKGAEKKSKADQDGATADFQAVWEQRCLFPGLGKKAAKGLKKLGVMVDQAALRELGPEGLTDPDIAGRNHQVRPLLERGLKAELAARYPEARDLYQKAVQADPADPTALRFLAELNRHHLGEWDTSEAQFKKLLAQPADPIAKAVALHGIGKMTIHSGRYSEGLAMFERSVKVYPLAITYRNMAVYWFSEKQAEKATGHMRQALELDPDDKFNQIFSAVYLAAAGHAEEALKIARAHEDVLDASYNLAALWAQTGDTKKAMELLRRHFYEYEKYDSVRAMEMQEARDDYMFAELHKDPEFVALTAGAMRHGAKR